ncbi:hypothetical protein BGY98DRAFT_1188244 [Russula aff. rugulosa BPL654]|nr:hypothetical protein BGY98DRAFT_1188244 [Russula aff. rugulosa BPL654]
MDDVKKKAPLAVYAAAYWVHHAQFEDVASRIKGMEDLFDLDKPYFAAWRGLYDIDITPPDGPRDGSVFDHFGNWKSGSSTPLYYAALCGFADLVEQLIAKHPQHVNAIGGYCKTPAVAALAGRHFQLAQFRYYSSTGWMSIPGSLGNTPLVSAIFMIQMHGTWELYATASCIGKREDRDSALTNRAWSNVEVKDDEGRTPLDVARGEQHEEIVNLLLEHLTT